MAYRPHVRVTFNGGMPGGERWSCSLAFGSDLALPWQPQDPELLTMAEQAQNVWSVFHKSFDAHFSEAVTLQRTDARVIDETGRTIRLQQVAPALPVAGQNNPLLPNQCAVVLSLRTATPGARGRGRLYLPALHVGADLNGRLAASVRDKIADVAKTMLDGMNTAAETAGYAETNALCIASGVGLGSCPDVRQLKVGDVIDTQRRRRDAIVESYATRNLALSS